MTLAHFNDIVEIEMILLNYSHPFTGTQLDQIRAIVERPSLEIKQITVCIDPEKALEPQVVALADEVGLSAEAWQTESILVNPPALNFIAVALLAELHGRAGYFPAVVRTRPVASSLPPRYEVAEIINLQSVRDLARKGRG